MECILEAHPVPDILWFRGDKQIVDSDKIKMCRKAVGKDTYELSLEIKNPTREDGGNYRCNAINQYGESNANIALNFQGKTRRIGMYPTTYCVGALVSVKVRRIRKKNGSQILSAMKVNKVEIYFADIVCKIIYITNASKQNQFVTKIKYLFIHLFIIMLCLRASINHISFLCLLVCYIYTY